jgi:NAD(P)-dependent dehydrogenase (short-subunit alcohol dehydrogenase family)
MTIQKIALVTGASSGIGQATARLLARRGYRVIGTSRDPSAGERLPAVELVPLDVRSDASVSACIEAVLRQEGRIAVLVNNAGYELAGALEEVTLDEAKAQFETNFFGVVRMVRSVLPVMRRQRRGRIINISSLQGLTSVPFLGIYSASKFAVEGYTEALRHEVRPFNIHVSLVEAGFVKTNIGYNRQVAARHIDEYDPWRQRAQEAIRESEENAPGPELVAKAVLAIAESKAPRLRHQVGRQAKWVSGLRRILPEAAFERGVRRTFRLDARA